MQSASVLLKRSVRGYIPLTGGRNVRDRKRILRSLLERAIGNDLVEARNSCRGRELTLKVTFYLLGNSSEQGRKKKDLDNLLKLLLDVLSEYMVAKGSPNREEGLGIITDDDQVYEIQCSKKLVNDPTKEGIDFELSEHETIG